MVIAAPPATAPPVTSLTASTVTAANPAPHGWTTHTVQPGDTLIGIAARYRTTVGAIAARNDIRDRALIVAGTRLSVPRTTAPTVEAAALHRGAGGTVHVVRPGETLGGIAARYGTPLASLLKANRLGAAPFIHPGQQIAVRGGAATASAARRPRPRSSGTGHRATGCVPATPWARIAIRHRTSVGAMAKASGISTPADDPPRPAPHVSRPRQGRAQEPHAARHLQRRHVPRRGRRQGRRAQPGDPRQALGAQPHRDQGDDHRHGPSARRGPDARAGHRLPGVRLEPARRSPSPTPSASCRSSRLRPAGPPTSSGAGWTC